MAGSMAIKGLIGLYFASFMVIFLPFCGRFCELICDCLWHVQRIVLGDVWIKNMVYGMFKGLF